MAFLIAAAALFVALLAGTAIEFPRLCCGGWRDIELSQARPLLLPPCCCHGPSCSSVSPWDYSCVPESFTKSASSGAGFNTSCRAARNPA
jgi:hypothetical protein